MPTTNYHELLQRIKSLRPTEQARLLRDLATLVHCQIQNHSPQSILDMQGLGKEIWSNIDAQKYIDRERDSWNG